MNGSPSGPSRADAVAWQRFVDDPKHSQLPHDRRRDQRRTSHRTCGRLMIVLGPRALIGTISLEQRQMRARLLREVAL
jgi:hypothetical protein